jgi:hypothetical protein
LKYILATILFLGALSVQAQSDQVLSIHLENSSFEELVSHIEEETGLTIFFRKEQTADLSVTISSGAITVREALESALRGTGLNVSPWNKGYVILLNEKLPEELPVFMVEQQQAETRETEQVTTSEERYLQGRKSDVTETIVIGDKNIQSNGKIRVAGKVTDLDTGEPVIGATVYIEETKTGAATDVQGFFVILLPRGKYNARFASMGYETGKYLLDVYSNGRIEVSLKNSPLSIQEAVIMGDRQMDIRRKDPGLEKISIQSIKALPVMMGERDIIKVSEMLPGIVSVGEGSAGLNVRGGSSDQNAFYINNIPVYNTSHLFGFFPAFNSDIIKDFSIYKGHVPAKYGGRLASVFNIITRQGNKKEFSLHGGVNPISANVTLEGPVKKDVSSVLLSARSSYSDWILSEINDPVLQNSSAGFNDFSFYLDHHMEKTVVSAFVYASNDRFDLSDINSYRYANRGASLNMSHNFNNLLRMDLSMVGSKYGFNTVENLNVPSAYTHSYAVNHYEIRADFTQTINQANELYFGFSGINYRLDRGSVLPFGEESLRSPIHHGKEQGLETALYVADKYDLTRWLTIHAGFRYAVYAPLGPERVFTYPENRPKELLHIADTLFFEPNQPLKWYHSPEARVSVNIVTDQNGTVKLAFNQMGQNLFMLNNTIAIAPNTQWKLADYHIRPSRSNQYSAGVFRNLPEMGMEASGELFYKLTDDYTEYRDGADFINNPFTETVVLQGAQESYGVELLLKRTRGRLNGWLAYTWSRSFVHVTGAQPWEQINNGKIYPSNYDIPHAMNAVVNYSFSKRVTLSGVITYQKGKPVTYPVSVYYMDGIPTIDFYERNKYRIPDYFRTDLSLTIEGNLKRDKLIHSSWMFSLYNATGRKNAYSVYFMSEQARIRSYKYSVFGVPFFTATWLFKLGNYASQ